MYKKSYRAALAIHRMSHEFPGDQYYFFTGHLRRSSRSACFLIGEALRKKNYPELFASRMVLANDAIAETILWLNYAWNAGYISTKTYSTLYLNYAQLHHTLSQIIASPEKFFPRRK